MSLELHPEKGVNPRLAVCRKCGKDVGVVLLGNHAYKDVCHCGMVSYGGRPHDGCPSCREPRDGRWARQPIEDNEKLPIEICEDCEAKQKAAADVVAEGGIYWRCSDCGSEGAIRKSAPIVAIVREQMKIPTGSCGVEFGKKDCPVCSAGTAEKAPPDEG